MKNYVKFVSLVLLLILIFFTFTSCGGVKYGYLVFLPNELRAAKIMDILSTKIDEADSYTCVGETTIVGMVDELDITINNSVEEKRSGLNGVHPMKLSKATYVYDYFYDQRDLTFEIIDGYQYGQFYRQVKNDDGFESKMTSPATKDEFFEYNEALLEEEKVMIDFAETEIVSERAKDGSWIINATITDLASIDYIDDFEQMTEGYKISGFEIRITAKKDFSEWETRLNYIFEKIDGYNEQITDRYTASVEVVSNFSNFNSTEVEKLDLSEYYICSDLRMIGRISEQLNNKLEIPEGSFDVSIEQNGTVGRASISYHERSVVEYGNNEKGFFYSADCSSSATHRTWINYSEGKKVENGEHIESSDEKEKNYFNSLFTSGFFNEQYITLIETDPNNPAKIIFTLEMSDDVLRIINNGEKTFNKGSIEVVFTMSGDKVIAVYTEARLWSTTNLTNKVTITNNCKFEEPVSNSGDTIA